MHLDLAQNKIKEKLDNLAVLIKENSKKTWLQKVFSKNQNQTKSLYIYGDVGRGKTMLMRGFFNQIHQVEKSYFHFNVFMNEIHQALKKIRQQKNNEDELILAVKMVIGKTKLICFDEFQVNDIADAMLLARIFSYIFFKKIIVIFTSNSQPNQLYKHGLQRELFLEFVNKVLLKNCKILHLQSEIDYRTKFFSSLEKRYFFNNKNDCANLKNIIKKFTEKDSLKTSILKVWGRDVKIKRCNKKIAIFTLAELCYENFAASDYRAICQNFDLIFLLKLGLFAKEEINEARRLTSFIDELYENKTALIIFANCDLESDIEKIYANLTNATWSKRSLSRLQEIKSDHYWLNSKINS